MSIRILVKCDGPKCRRERDSSKHANTWFKIVFQLSKGEEIIIDVCSLVCMQTWVSNELDLTNMNTMKELNNT